MGITELADLVRRRLDQLERLARDADHDQPWAVKTDWTGPAVLVNDTLDGAWTRDGIGVTAAYTCDDPQDDCRDARAGYEAEAQMIAERCDPATVLREVAAKRRLLDQVLAWEHGRDDRDDACWAVLQPGRACDCGRDERILAVLQALAAPYQETT